MKKFLLFVLVLSFTIGGFAQHQYVAKKAEKRIKDGTEQIVERTFPAPVLNYNKSVNEDVNRIYVGKASSQRTIRREEARVISYNKDLDLISITFVLDPATYPSASENGIIGVVYSSDHGQTWSDPVVLAENAEAGFTNYYPAGIVFNPEGNTTITDAYGVSQSTGTLGGNWAYKVFGSTSLGGANNQVDVFHNPDNEEDGYWNFLSLSQVGQQARCMSIVPTGAWGAYETAALQPIYGDFTGTAFDWDYSQTVDMDLYQSTEDGVMAWVGMWQGMDSGAEMAWSNDGQTGYIWMLGMSNESFTGYQPIVFKTVDGGDSWDFIELDFLTDEMQTILDPYIIETYTGLMIPHIFESAGAVDHRGDLQIFCAMGSTSADVTQNPDSIGWTWTYPGDIFNISVDDNGIKNLIWVDSLRTSNPTSTTEGNYCGTDGWQHRISVAKNDFENEFFVNWADTRDNSTLTDNIEPDVFGWSINVHTGEHSDPVCFTEGTLYEKFYYFTCGAEYAIYDETTQTYTIPYMQVVTPAEYASNGSASGDPVSINYVTGIEFPALGEYVSVNELEKASGISVSQNQPNPFTGNTTITVSTETAAPVMVEVSNLVGQTIYTINAGTVNGTQEVVLSSNNLRSGVYFYTVHVGNESVTNKMIVE